MDTKAAEAVLQSIKGSRIDEDHLTIHSMDDTHMEKSKAISEATSRTTSPCGYFQHATFTKKTIKKDEGGWQLAKPIVKFIPTGGQEDLSVVESKRLVKAFFAQSGLVAGSGSGSAGKIEGPIPSDYFGYTNTPGSADHQRCYNMRVIIGGGTSNWQIITLYPIN